MKIESLKDLRQVLQLCQRLGVTDIKIDGIEAKIQPVKATRSSNFDLELPPEASMSVPLYQAQTSVIGGNDVIEDIDMPDQLTDDQLLMWSSKGELT